MQLAFQFVPKVFSGVKVKTLEFFYTTVVLANRVIKELAFEVAMPLFLSVTCYVLSLSLKCLVILKHKFPSALRCLFWATIIKGFLLAVFKQTVHPPLHNKKKKKKKKTIEYYSFSYS